MLFLHASGGDDPAMTGSRPAADGPPAILTRPDGATIAYHASPGKAPGVIFCPGFMSDMGGTKAMALEAACHAAGRGYVRFDYQGHGLSSGKFEDGTIGRWSEDTLAILDDVAQGPQVLVGSSMGGWIMLLAALARPERVAGLVGVAPAADATQELMWAELSDEIKEVLRRDGVWRAPSQYSDEPYAITLNFIEEGRNHLLLGGPIPIRCPVRVHHGMEDPDVPWRHSLRLVDALQSDDVTVTFVKRGDHRLSEPADIARLCDTVETLCQEVA
jgi:pimeloyl-ACP methyl ester carboxylesterase